MDDALRSPCVGCTPTTRTSKRPHVFNAAAGDEQRYKDDNMRREVWTRDELPDTRPEHHLELLLLFVFLILLLIGVATGIVHTQ